MIYFVIVLICLFGTIVTANNSPVVVWGDDITASTVPALHTVSQDEFSNIFAPLLKNHMIIAFQENDLDNDNFRCTLPNGKQSCYAYLRDVPSKTYYSNVENPINALREMASTVEFNDIGTNGKLEEPISCSVEKVVFVNFNEMETEINVLKSHDNAIKSISEEIECPVIYMYLTASSDKMNHRSRRATAASNGGYVFRYSNQLLLFFTNLYYINNGVSQEVIIDNMLVTASTNKLSVSLTGTPNTVTFDVIYSGGYYNMSNLKYNDMAFLSTSVYAPTTFSYYCGNLTAPATSALTTYQLQWNSFQMQAPFGSTTNESFVFSESWDCVGFVTPGIIMGLFIVVLFLLITFIGICWMMDINTMDRFDDPKGKTITINTGE